MASSTVEDYIKRIYTLQQRLGPKERVPVGQVAASVDVVPGTATTMMKALAESGLVRYELRQGVPLRATSERTTFGEIEQITSDTAGREKLPSMMRRLNLHVFLNFAAGVKGKQRAVRVLAGGLITTRDAELPIRPYGGGKDGRWPSGSEWTRG